MSNPTMDESVKRLAECLSGPNVKQEIREMVVSLFADEYVKFVQITFNEGPTPMLKSSSLLEPSDLFLELIAALAALDFDKVASINHMLRS